MIQLEVYNSKLEVLGMITSWYSLRWRRKYFGIGEFEIHVEANPNNLELIQENNLVTRLDADEVGIIENITLKEKAREGDVIIITGKFLEVILDSRIMLETETFKGNAENSLRTLVTKNIINPINKARKIDKVVLGANNKHTDVIDVQLGLGKNLATMFEKICKVTNLSTRFYIDYETMQIKFEVWKGRDLRDLIILSDEDGNITNSNYESVVTAYRSFGLVAGQGEGIARKRLALDDGATGWNRKEFYIDARDIQDTETIEKELVDEEGNPYIEYEERPITEAEYNKLLETRGREKMADKIKYINFESETTESVNDRYKKDWDLGDIVTVYKTRWHKEIQERITEVEETFENGIIKIYPIFGSPLPELKDILKENEY